MNPKLILSTGAALALTAGVLCAQMQNMDAAQRQSGEGLGQAIVTVIPSGGGSAEKTIQVSQQDIKEIKVAGKPSQVTGWTPLRGQPVELVVLIDNEARSNFGSELSEIKQFAQELPPQTSMSVAWMENGRAVLGRPLSSDPAQITQGIHLPSGASGTNASPYFSLSDLAKNWPSQNRHARREVLMICDGIDDYNPRYDPNDPYVQSAINDSVRAGMVVYSVFWPDRDRFARFGWGQDAGQNLLTQLTGATGGINFWQGTGSPVSIEPYLKDLRQRLANQYAITFTAPGATKPSVERLDLKFSLPSAKVDSPRLVLVQPTTQAKQ